MSKEARNGLKMKELWDLISDVWIRIPSFEEWRNTPFLCDPTYLKSDPKDLKYAIDTAPILHTGRRHLLFLQRASFPRAAMWTRSSGPTSYLLTQLRG